jgi:hypothetical protein
MKRLFLLAAVLLGACGPTPLDNGVLGSRRQLTNGDSIYQVEYFTLTSGPEHLWCAPKDVQLTPSMVEGDLVRFRSDSCSYTIERFDTPKDGTTVKQ